MGKVLTLGWGSGRGMGRGKFQISTRLLSFHCSTKDANSERFHCGFPFCWVSVSLIFPFRLHFGIVQGPALQPTLSGERRRGHIVSTDAVLNHVTLMWNFERATGWLAWQGGSVESEEKSTICCSQTETSIQMTFYFNFKSLCLCTFTLFQRMWLLVG